MSPTRTMARAYAPVEPSPAVIPADDVLALWRRLQAAEHRAEARRKQGVHDDHHLDRLEIEMFGLHRELMDALAQHMIFPKGGVI